MLGLQPVDHRGQAGVGPAQVREDLGVLERVVGRDGPAVGGAVGAEGPVVLPHRHLADRGASHPGRQRALPDLPQDVAQLGQLTPQVVVDVDQVLPGRLREVGVLETLRRGRDERPARLVPDLAVAEPGAVVEGRDGAQPVQPAVHHGFDGRLP